MTISSHYPQPEIPVDFPRPEHMGALPGAQPKLLAVMYEGKFYIPGCTPPEMVERVTLCNEIIDRITTMIKEVHESESSEDLRNRILSDYLAKIKAASWTSHPEAHWIIRKVAEQLSWEVPKNETA